MPKRGGARDTGGWNGWQCKRKPQHATLSSHPRLQSPTASASLLHWPNKGRSLAQKAFSLGFRAAWPRKLFLWASEGDVRHPRAALKPSSAAGRPAAASLWPVRSLPLLFTHGPRPQTFLQAAAWPRKLFLWASEGNVRHARAPPSNPPRPLAGLPRPLCGLSEACLFSSPTGPARKRSCRPQLGPESFFYGLPKATLDTHGPRPQTLLGSRQACRGLSVACPKPASSLRPRAPPANVPAGRSLAQKAFSMGFRRRR